MSAHCHSVDQSLTFQFTKAIYKKVWSEHHTSSGVYSHLSIKTKKDRHLCDSNTRSRTGLLLGYDRHK